MKHVSLNCGLCKHFHALNLNGYGMCSGPETSYAHNQIPGMVIPMFGEGKYMANICDDYEEGQAPRCSFEKGEN